MKIGVIDINKSFIFINNNYLNDIDFNSNEDIILFVKNIIIKYKSKLNMRGFYKVKVLVKEKIGLFIDIIRLDDNEYSNIVDLKVIVNKDKKIYFKTYNYDVLPKNINIYYSDNCFYCDVEDIDNMNDVVEFGEYIYGRDINYVINNSINL